MVFVEARADRQDFGVGVRAILQTMPVALAARKAGAIAGAQQFLAVVADQHDFAAQHVDEFVLVGVPVTLARPDAGREAQQAHAELGQAGRVAELDAVAFPIVPLVKRIEGNTVKLFRRNPLLCTPKDFDYSPFFEIIKYPFLDLTTHSSFCLVPWHSDLSNEPEALSLSKSQLGVYLPDPESGSEGQFVPFYGRSSHNGSGPAAR